MGRTADKSIFKRVFQLDLRSLALFRIGVGFVILLDLFTRARNLVDHYTDAGVLPRAVAMEHGQAAWEWTLHTAGGSAGFQILMFALAALFAIALILGYQTRIATIACWVLLASLYARNTILGHVGDVALRHILFFGMFLPLGARYSVDAARNPDGAKTEHRYRSAAVVGLLLQVAFIYYFAAIHKAHPMWVGDGTALYYALSIDQVTTSWGAWMLQFPGLLKAMTFGTILIEVIGPLLLFSPFATGRTRTAAVVLFVGFHLGIGSLQNLGLLPIASICVWLALVPTWAWDRWPPRIGATLSAWYARLESELSGFQRWVPAGRIGSTPADLALSRTVAAFVGATTVLIFFWNVSTVRQVEPFFQLPKPVRNVGIALRIEQGWTMFSPTPLTTSGWPVLPAQLADGTTVDLATSKAVDWGKPVAFPRRFASIRWKGYLMAMWHQRRDGGGEWGPAFDAFPEYLCRDWNGRHPPGQAVRKLEVYRMREWTTLPEEPPIDPQRLLLYEHECGGTPTAYYPSDQLVRK